MNRPAPLDPFKTHTRVQREDSAGDLEEALASFKPSSTAASLEIKEPARHNAPETGIAIGQQSRRRGKKIEPRTKMCNFRLRPSEYDALDQFCEEQGLSFPDAVMMLLNEYRQGQGN